MDGMVLMIFLLASFLGGLTSGLAGFAMGLVVSGVWLHILTPVQTASLITGYGLLVQGYGIWKLRHAFKWRNVMPFIAGGAIGVPIGTYLLTYVQPAYLRTAVGVLRLEQAVSLDDLQALGEEGRRAWLLPADRLLEHLPRVELDEPLAARFVQGQAVHPGAASPGPCRVYAGGALLGVGERSAEGGLQPARLVARA